MKYFLVGIKGTGMSALAKVLKDMGYDVEGSDCEEVYFTDSLLKDNMINVKVFNKENITENITYIISSCYNKDNEEVREIINRSYKYYYYHKFIEIFFKNKYGISGVHGKSTTTSFATDLFRDKKIAALIGDGTGFGNIEYDSFIFEACEYKNHILTYSFKYLVITNIDADHLDFFQSINDIYNTFKKASENAEILIANEEVNIEHRNKYTFGKNKNNFCYYEILEESNSGYKLKIVIDNNKYEIIFPYYGEHMILNLLAAITLYYLVNKELDNLQEKINNFRKINRRMNEHKYHDNIIIDDYAHHPTEIRALLKGIKQKYNNKEISVIFQPHTYSRTLKLKEEFKECFKLCDKLYLMKTFTSKREKYDEELEKEVSKIFNENERFDDLMLESILNRNNQVIVFLGAGNFNKYINYENIFRK